MTTRTTWGFCGLYSTKTAIELCQQADCVVGIGASLNEYTTESGYLFPDAAYVHIDVRPHVVLGDGRAADCYLQSDARLGLDAILTALAGSPPKAGYRTPEVEAALARATDDPKHYDIEPGTVDPREVCRAIDEIVPSEVGLVFGSGQQGRFGLMLLTGRRPLMIAQHHFGCIGQGLTVAIGAVLASGNQPTFLLEGDAGFMMHLAEFETAVRYDVPLLVLVMNDQALGAEYHKALATDLDVGLTTIPTPDLGAVGRSLGGRGATVRSLDDLADALRSFVDQPGPMLVDVRTSRQVLSIPYRRLWFGEDV